MSEFKVDNSTFSAEYGRNSGAIVNIATRSGSNELHGEAFDFYRDDQFDSRNYFNPPSRTPQVAVQPQPVRRQPRRTDREEPTFFFVSYEGLRHAQGVDLNSGDADATRSARRSPIRCRGTCCQFIPLANDLAQRQARLIGSALAPVNIDQYTGDIRHNLRQNDDLHVYYAFQSDLRQRAERAGQHRARASATRAAATGRS